MFVSWWLIVPVVIAVAILFVMVSRLSNEGDKLEKAEVPWASHRDVQTGESA